MVATIVGGGPNHGGAGTSGEVVRTVHVAGAGTDDDWRRVLAVGRGRSREDRHCLAGAISVRPHETIAGCIRHRGSCHVSRDRSEVGCGTQHHNGTASVGDLGDPVSGATEGNQAAGIGKLASHVEGDQCDRSGNRNIGVSGTGTERQFVDAGSILCVNGQVEDAGY